MINLDYAPAVFAGIILIVLLVPALYGLTLVDAFWKKNKETSAAGDDAFN